MANFLPLSLNPCYRKPYNRVVSVFIRLMQFVIDAKVLCHAVDHFLFTGGSDKVRIKVLYVSTQTIRCIASRINRNHDDLRLFE